MSFQKLTSPVTPQRSSVCIWKLAEYSAEKLEAELDRLF